MRSRVQPSLLVIGLGNPGREYEETRHNAGFLVIRRLCERHNTRLKKGFLRPWVSAGTVIADEAGNTAELLLAQPLTYMNRSGVAVAGLLASTRTGPERLVVVYDTLDLAPGEIRVKPRGSSGGQRGIASIIDVLGTDEFIRIAVGIGRPADKSGVVDWVLSRPEGSEGDRFAEGLADAAEATEALAFDRIDAVMSRFNGIRRRR